MSKKNKVFPLLGAGGTHSNYVREKDDSYATDPHSLELLLEQENFNSSIWECACGGGHLVDLLKSKGYTVFASDIVDRGVKDMQIMDFLSCNHYPPCTDIITNPPYKHAKEFVLRALALVDNGCKVAMLLRMQFLEGIARYNDLFSQYPPQVVYVHSKRVQCARGGDFVKHNKGSAQAFCWFVWQKGVTTPPIIKWL